MTGPGYAVIDLETTGIHPGRHERIVEIGVVHLSPQGHVTGCWETLVNPQRDLGPQRIHGIAAAEVLRAPRFEQISGELAELLMGRVIVAHNLRFDAGFLAAEFARCEVTPPISHELGLCTMTLARRYLPGAGRSLADCCAAFGISIDNAHRAIDDAAAAAHLLAGYLDLDPQSLTWSQALADASSLPWPRVQHPRATWCPRGHARREEEHFLTRLVERMPDPCTPELHSAYLAILDQALLDRHISVTEADALVAVAQELNIGRTAARELHTLYVRELAKAAWADGVITDDERHDLLMVADMLGLANHEVDTILETERTSPSKPTLYHGSFHLEPGDLVVFTGDMSRPRSEWESAAAAAGLQPHGAVTKKVKLLVAADPDSQSGKARKARDYSIPVITETAFGRMLDSITQLPA
ncbi:exonuclease domain-containing protein [Saccharopolyspora phatthalungensis]|uniref:DNA polymerase-3 subunit epsilon n=1 Tax=Saccharopolyspora phatthalungensis TaxID=664693 RepID=A0A840PZJ1_9PSEU|nr:exonuclease domain-containing protein [Saccharopolyspora phatthalungensis]MBB5153706.1 DNA polymerase-3 subunit epsilon [Saccharopolyspora phatthalungensis]